MARISRTDEDEDQHLATLVGGIIEDGQKLIREELALARAELQDGWAKASSAGSIIASAAIVLTIGGILLAFGLVYLLQAITSLPLWLDYVIVSVLLLGGGLLLLSRGRKKIKRADLAVRETLESVKENVQWIQRRS